MRNRIATTVALAAVLAGSACAKRKEPTPAAKDKPGPGGATPAPVGPVGDATDMTAVVGDAEKIAVGDLDGDGKADVALATGSALKVVDLQGKVLGEGRTLSGIQTLAIADADGDGKQEILAGWGRTRAEQGGVARISIHRLEGGALTEELVVQPRSTRQDIAAIVPLTGPGGGLFVAWFADKYQVASARAVRGPTGWQLTDAANLRMALSYAFGDVDGDGQEDMVVGRVYGDDQDAVGDAFVLRPDGSRTPIPTNRGVRGLAIADLDGDGKNEIYLGDGWDKDYGKVARGFLSVVRWDGSAFRSQLIDDSPGQYTIWRIIPADVDGDGKLELVTRGSKYVRVYKLTGGAWQAVNVGGGNPRDAAVGELDGKPGADILVAGENATDKSEAISLRQAPWAPVSISASPASP